jgi:hypothetical protein
MIGFEGSPPRRRVSPAGERGLDDAGAEYRGIVQCAGCAEKHACDGFFCVDHPYT